MNEIEKEWTIIKDGFTIKIVRNKRKDVFIESITDGRWSAESNIPVFMTFKSAKKHAISIVESLKF